MALGGKKKKPAGKSGGKKESEYVTVFQILQGKETDEREAEPYAKANDYKGRLIWQKFGGEEGDDEENSTFYEIKKAFIGKPHESAPEFVLQTLVVNLKNPNAAEVLDT
jgi:hypothetical protein